MAKKSPFLVWTPQFWSKDPKKPLHYGAFIGELITLKDTPPILNRFGSRAPTPRKKNTSWPISPLYSIYIQKKVRDQNKMSQTHLNQISPDGCFNNISTTKKQAFVFSEKILVYIAVMLCSYVCKIYVMTTPM